MSIRKLLTGIVLLVLLTGCCGIALGAEAPPVLPSFISGEVKSAEGTPIVAGTVKAFINGELRGQIDFKDGQYQFLVVNGDDASNNLPITFRVTVDGVDMTAATEPAAVAWQSGAISGVDDYPSVILKVQKSGSLPSNLPGVQPPNALPVPGIYREKLAITLTTPTPNAIIYYTVDGSDPSTGTNRKQYSAPFAVEQDTTVKAVVTSGGAVSEIRTFAYTVQLGGTTTPPPTSGSIAAPAAQPVAGEYYGSVTVTLAADDPEAAIYYTQDGSDPVSSPTRAQYQSGIALSRNTMIKAYALKGEQASEVVSFSYVIRKEESRPEYNFTDMANHWARDYVNTLVNKGIISGYQDQTFKPDNRVNRAECATILVRALGLKAEAETILDSFADINELPLWSRPGLAAAVSAGLMNGIPQSDGMLALQPSATVSRTQLAVIASRVLEKQKGAVAGAELKFADLESIPSWARPGIQSAVASGLVKGYPDNTFRGDNSVSRGEMAALVFNLLNQL